MHRNLSVPLIVTLTVTLSQSQTYAAEQTLPEPGPENGGLRLRLTVENHLEQKSDSRTIHLQLLNVGEKPLTLVGQWDYEKPTGDYAAWFRHATEFTTFPKVTIDTAGTTGEERRAPQPTAEFKPGETLTVKWQESGRVLKYPDRDWWDHDNTAPTLPSAGMYAVRAQLTVVTAGGKRLLLASNEQPVIIGGKKTLPKFATTRVLSVNARQKTAEIRLGSDHRIEPGDVFHLHHPEQKGRAWQLMITRTETWWSAGTVKLLEQESPAAQQFPQPGWLATLVPRERLQLRVSKLIIEEVVVGEQCRGSFVVRNAGSDYETQAFVYGPSYGVFIYDAEERLLFRNFGGWGPGMKRGEEITLRWNTSSNHLGETSEPPFLIPKPGKYTLTIRLYEGNRDRILEVATTDFEAHR